MIKEVSSVLLLGGLLISLVVGHPVEGQGPSVVGQGSSVEGQGPSVVGQGPSVEGQGPSVVGHGPSVVGQGPSVVGQGPSVVGHGPSVVGQGPSVVGQGPYYIHRPTNINYGSLVGNYYPLTGYQARTPISYTQMDVNAAAFQLIQVLAAQQTQLKHQDGQSQLRVGGCNLIQGVTCVEQIGGVVASCIANPTAAGIVDCVEKAIGVGHSCYGCICFVLQTFGIRCGSVDGVQFHKIDQSAILKIGFKDMMMVERRPIQVESMSEMAVVGAIRATGCNFFQTAICTAEIGGTVAGCIAESFFPGLIAACVAEVVTVGSSCHGCICAVMRTFGVQC